MVLGAHFLYFDYTIHYDAELKLICRQIIAFLLDLDQQLVYAACLLLVTFSAILRLDSMPERIPNGKAASRVSHILDK